MSNLGVFFTVLIDIENNFLKTRLCAPIHIDFVDYEVIYFPSDGDRVQFMYNFLF